MSKSNNILSSKAMLSHLKVSRWGGRLFDKATSAEILAKKRADDDAGVFTQRLIKRQAFVDIQTAEHEARDYHTKHTQPWFDDGPRILPTALYMSYIKAMNDVKANFDQAVEDFLKEYPNHVREAQCSLGDLFNRENYPSVEEMRAKHSIEFIITNCPDTSDFRCDLPQALLDEIKADLEKRLKGQLDHTVVDASERILNVVGRMADRLKAYKPGDREAGVRATGTFRDSLVSNVRELAEILPAFNLRDDNNLSKVISRISKELCEYDADVLREDEQVRATVTKSAEEILASVNGFIK